MKRIILLFCIFNVALLTAMDAPSKRRSISGRSNSLLARHQRHSSLGDKVLSTLSLKTDDEVDCSSNVVALITDRKSESSIEPGQKSDEPGQSNSQFLAERAAENNKKQFIKMTGLAYEAIKKIKTPGDAAHKFYLSNLKYAKHYYTSWMSLEITKDPRALDYMVQEEFNPLQETFNEKMASIAIQKK